MLSQVYTNIPELQERRLLLGSLASPLLTSALAQRLLEQKGYLVVENRGHQAEVPQREQSWALRSKSASEFQNLYTATQQEEFAFLFYFAVWGAIETSKHNMLETRRDRLLKLGLSPPCLPKLLWKSACLVMSWSDELSACIGPVTRYFLDLTHCLLQAVSNVSKKQVR
ncbi:hypothetical protein PoB_000697600 [Plakobranchus ocellatus]|uniref:Uncharacterized protein n=1 Tax=Plakobranchus ocellatus TaxID=259542 RepID=A0AAV3YDK4_9GAST|nr:hypothetical protein PoB_000697600 [Plakobranchus ocellatus]